MSLLADINANLPDFRRQAEALMVDTIRFAEPGTEAFDPDTGEYATTPGATIYDGPCQVQVGTPSPRDVVVGEQEVIVERTVIKIPWNAAEVPPNSVGEITAVGSQSGTPLGTRYRVTGSHDKTYATARRLPCERVSP